MSSLSLNNRDPSKPRSRPGRAERPERVFIGGKAFDRNDVIARDKHVAERTINREDRHGAPFLYLYGVKYRPVEEYDAFLLGRVQTHKPTPPRRRRASP